MFRRILIWVAERLLDLARVPKAVVIPRAEPVVRFCIEHPMRGWVYQYDTEPEARAFLAAYYGEAYPGGPVNITRFVNDREEAQVTVTPSTFDPALPLFPLEASAA